MEKVDDSITCIEDVSEFVADGVETTVITITDGVTISSGPVGNGMTRLAMTSVEGANKVADMKVSDATIAVGRLGVAMVFVARKWPLEIGCPQAMLKCACREEDGYIPRDVLKHVMECSNCEVYVLERTFR